MRGITVRGNTGLRVGLLGALALLAAVAVPASAVATAPTAADEPTHLVLTRTSGIDQNHTVRHELTCQPVGGDLQQGLAIPGDDQRGTGCQGRALRELEGHHAPQRPPGKHRRTSHGAHYTEEFSW